MTTPTIIIPKFVGGQGSTLEWPGWLEQRIQRPGAVRLDLADPVAIVPDATYYNRYKVNDIETSRWEKENNAVLAFRTALIAALDEPSRRLLADPGGGTAVFNLMLDEMIERLHQQYGNIAPSLVSAVAHQLDDPYQPGTDMLAFLARHTELQRILAQAGEQLQDGAKIRHAREAISKGTGTIYDSATAIYEERCRTAQIPARMTWEGYCDAMVAAALRHNTFGT
ncbi:hypothetical protein B484DRAFT_424377, partial [Ochromonadaceae sp. CCMP2298]